MAFMFFLSSLFLENVRREPTTPNGWQARRRAGSRIRRANPTFERNLLAHTNVLKKSIHAHGAYRHAAVFHRRLRGFQTRLIPAHSLETKLPYRVPCGAYGAPSILS
jgi:hypothetical protein